MTEQTIEIHVPLNKLVPSANNVRRVESAAGVEPLAASLLAHGLIQNITVRKKGSKYEVVAGARRFAAYRYLAKEGKIAKDFPVRAKELTDERDLEISLAENVERSPMHPADEIEAFKALNEKEGLSPEELGARFGMSHMTVRRRLKLASLSPRILDAFRQNECTLEQAQALAVTDDHAAQEAAFFEVSGWQRQPGNIRATLTEEKLSATDRIVKFIGIEAYQAAGGAVECDLFSEETETFLTDRTLAVRLATEQLAADAEAIREAEGWSWAEAMVDMTYLHQFGRIPTYTEELTEEEAARIQSLYEAMDEITSQIDGMAEDDPEIQVLVDKQTAMELEIDGIQNAKESHDPEEMKLAGVFVGINRDGTFRYERGLVRPEDRPALEKLRASAHADEAEAEAGDREGRDEVEDEAPAAEEIGLSAAVNEELTAIRTAALRVELASRPTVALAAILHPLARRFFYDMQSNWSVESVVEVRGEAKALDGLITAPLDCKAMEAWNAIVEKWTAVLPDDIAALWDWLLDQKEATLLELLAVVTAGNANAVVMRQERRGKRIEQADRIAEAVNLDMRRWWTPQQVFLSRLSKATIAAIMTEAGCSKDAAASMQKLPKHEAVIRAEAELSGFDWLPPAMIGKALPAGEDGEDDAAGAIVDDTRDESEVAAAAHGHDTDLAA